MGETKLWISNTNKCSSQSRLRVGYISRRKSFDSDQDFWARIVNNFMKIGIL